MTDARTAGRSRLVAIGPAIVVAAVVLGPGSILISSQVGAQFGYDLIWLLVASAVLMAGTVALAGRLGTCLDGSIGDELTRRIGRPVAATVGLVAFAIVACFQVSNDVAVLAALELFVDTTSSTARIGTLVGLNALVAVALFGFRHLYRKVEQLMKLLVLAMIACFAVNLWFAKPSAGATLAGLWPSWPADADVLATSALVATTFSVAGAFYQAYLVREKGWSVDDHRRGVVDSLVGIGVLGLVSLLIMVTAATTLHGRIDAAGLRSAIDVARQLEPLFGRAAHLLFGVGIFAGAISSFLVNAMIAGTLLADGLGLGSRMDDPWTRRFTMVALLTGLGVAIGAELTGAEVVDVIVFAQGLTVVGVPLLALTLLYLATRADLCGPRRIPTWMKWGGGIAVLVTVALSIRTAIWLLG